MRILEVNVQDLKSMQLVVGFVGENEHTRILFGAGMIYGEYPHAAASLTVSAPGAAPYPAVVSRDGDYVVWNVVDSNLVHEGDGEIQLAFTENGVVVKTYIGRIRILRSIVPTGEIPEALEDFLEQAGAALTAIPETIGEAFESVTAEAETLAAGSAAALLCGELCKSENDKRPEWCPFDNDGRTITKKDITVQT